jgi:hypothetical protein
MHESEIRCNVAAERGISDERCTVRDACVLEQGGKIRSEGSYTEGTERVRRREAVAFEVKEVASLRLVKTQPLDQGIKGVGCAA